MFTAWVVAAVLAQVPPPVRGDFDGDGKADVAEVVPGAGGKYQLVVRRAAAGRSIAVITTLSAEDLAEFYVEKIEPGRYPTWCGKIGRKKSDTCPRPSVQLKGDTLSFGTREASQLVAIWTGEGFEVEALSD